MGNNSTEQIHGYGRPKTKKQSKELKTVLNDYGCDSIYIERVGDGAIHRTKFDDMIDQLRTGDKVVVQSIYDFPITTLQLIDLFSGLSKEGIEVHCMRENIKNEKLYEVLDLYQRRSRSERSIAALPDPDRNPNVGRSKGMTQDTKELYLAIAQLKQKGFKTHEIKKELKIKSNRMIYEALELHGLKKSK